MSKRLSRLKIIKPRSKKSAKNSKKPTASDLINAESAIGRTLFGPIPSGHRREFFQYEKNIWLWHESWYDRTGKKLELTIRYEVRPEGVFKKPLGGRYTPITGAELENFRRAVHNYTKLVKEKIYIKA